LVPVSVTCVPLAALDGDTLVSVGVEAGDVLSTTKANEIVFVPP
jgi:hypothetical protein